MAERCDLHVHSKHSNRPSEWILRRIGAPECFTDPQAVYETARRRGMQYVTLTDHNCIQGALEIAHHPGAFISTELTAYFPEDQCKVHVLAWDITEQQFADLQELRANIYELRDYLVQEKVVHSCAHPLYSINDKLTLAHFEKLLVLFNVFEVMNGGRNKKGNTLMAAILRCLTREDLETLADRHGLEPKGDRPWEKGMTGGSDDHSGVFIAKGYTECPASADFRSFLQHVNERQSTAGGLHGTALSLAHSLYSIGYHYYRDKFFRHSGGGDALLKVLGEIVGPENTRVRFRDKVTHLAKKFTRRKTRPSELEFKRMVTEEMRELFNQEWQADELVRTEERYQGTNQRTFELASRVSNQLLFQFSKRFIKKLSRGSIFGSLEAVSAMGPVLFSLAPYLFSYAHQHRDRALLAEVSQRFFGDYPELKRPPKKAWFSDTLADVNGVAVLIQKMGKLAKELNHDLTLISLAGTPPTIDSKLHNFRPVGEFKLPENESITLGFPPFLEILDYCERQEFTEFIISTPAPLGLAALAIGKMMGLRLSSIYHTDLPQYIRYYTEDEEMEGLTWQYLRWFYAQMDCIYVPSKVYLDQLIAKGFHPAKLRLFPHGADLDAFHPRFRDPHFWEKYGGNGRTHITYVGRVAKEKDLDILVEVFFKLAKRHPECQLAVVGDGPYLSTMKEKLRSTKAVFTGFLHGEMLSRAYASSDIFLFPSTTDTFGNVIVEAMASGVPVVVSDKGGPREVVMHGRTGLVTKGRDVEAMLEAVEQLVADPDLRLRMAGHCRAFAETRSWKQIYLDFWSQPE